MPTLGNAPDDDVQLPVSLDDYRGRAQAIAKDRSSAVADLKKQAQAQADADREYSMERQKAILKWRGDGASWTAAEKLAEGDVAPLKWKREAARGLKQAAEQRIRALERSAASLRTEADMSKGLA